ncbi:Uncharacterized conserved protein, contains Mth938-like domain [Andreprevotia lacus DSM 23236]|jgi:uncharacterized protein|uniref:Uncharacterized conserved protein, contains Mth938-like domain n=1 Tax=Andreprevotia lacus DSM 23236 TaxID=1121001 RepID=A0A1W1Y0W0_9NEIS|nr:Mth938-like domain-containing protein [Andreprevotia lacus]SMC29764.1 Uncharacterized conserved protein, contains Mth938-like domain [Andreprevotia lacus DSM 23236]
MKLHHTSADHLNQFTTYGDGFVKINGVDYRGSVIVTQTEVREWRPARFEDLTEADFACLLELKPEMVLFGTGKGIRFPHPKLTRALAEAHVGLDMMDTGAMCRTFNILTAEERRVVAVLLGE